MHFLSLIICYFILFTSVAGFAQNTIKPYFTKEKIIIDGNLDEPVWSNIKPISRFISYLPDFGKILKDSTLAYIAYDEESIYCAFRCFESEPDKIVATLAARDKIINEDWVCISFDSKNDLQGMNSFVVNPRGIQYDSYSSATSEDSGVDLVWYSAGKLDTKGYTVEIQIPFKSLRYSNKLPVQMGFLLERKASKISTHVTYPEFDPKQGGAFLNQLGKIEFDHIKHYKLVEVLPSLTYSYHQSRIGGSLKEDLNKLEPGINLKYGITSSLILDATINPDFSQVEADAGQVDINLRSQLYYQEKRPFFLEGNDQYAVASTSSTVVDPIHYMIYTRAIKNPVAGVKLTGSINKKNMIALLYATDETLNATDDSKIYSHVPIIRYKYNYRDENYIGLMYSGRQDNFTGNHAYGLDGKIRINRSSFLEYNAYNTNTTLNKDKTNELINQSGHAFGLTYIQLKRNFDCFLTQRDVAKDFNVASGYFNRTGISQFTGLFRPKVYSDSLFVKRIDFEGFTSFTYDKFYDSWETFNHVSAQFYLWNTTVFKAKYSLSNEIFLGKKFDTSGFHVMLSGRVGNWLTAGILYRRTNAIYYSTNPYGGKSNRLTSSLILTPLPKLNISLSHILNDFVRKEDHTKVYDYQIARVQLTYQLNKYLFVRAIEEYNSYRKTLMSDFLASFTYIPGTVFHIGYGTLFQQEDANERFWGSSVKPVEEKRGAFLKISYLFRK